MSKIENPQITGDQQNTDVKATRHRHRQVWHDNKARRKSGSQGNAVPHYMPDPILSSQSSSSRHVTMRDAHRCQPAIHDPIQAITTMQRHISISWFICSGKKIFLENPTFRAARVAKCNACTGSSYQTTKRQRQNWHHHERQQNNTTTNETTQSFVSAFLHDFSFYLPVGKIAGCREKGYPSVPLSLGIISLSSGHNRSDQQRHACVRVATARALLVKVQK